MIGLVNHVLDHGTLGVEVLFAMFEFAGDHFVPHDELEVSRLVVLMLNLLLSDQIVG